MRIRNLAQSLLLISAALLAARSTHAQAADTANHQARPELNVQYNFLNSNAPPGDCGCFHLNGGSAGFAWPLKSGKFALAADVSASHAGSISTPDSTAGSELTLTTFLAGVRYSPRLGHSPLRLYGQVLAGGAHASGSLVSGSSTASNTSTAFAGMAGGGVDFHLSRHILIKLAEADYLPTTFNNGTNDHQNNLRVGAGLVLAF